MSATPEHGDASQTDQADPPAKAEEPTSAGDASAAVDSEAKRKGLAADRADRRAMDREIRRGPIVPIRTPPIPIMRSPEVEGDPKTRSAAAGRRAKSVKLDLKDPSLYLNREVTYLSFNRRVLAMAQDDRTPLLERVKFLAIVGSNLDEFFMKRIGGLKQQIGAGLQELTVDGRSPEQQLKECYEEIGRLEKEKNILFLHLIGVLAQNGIRILSYDGLNETERSWLRGHYLENIFPLVTPLGMDPAHPFPFISNLSLNLLVTLHTKSGLEEKMARVKVPVGEDVPRLVRIGDSMTFVPLEALIANNLDLLFPDMVIVSCECFRVTRNANTEKDEETADDLLVLIESELRDRKFAPIVRLEVEPEMSPGNRGMLAAELGLDQGIEVFEAAGMMGKRDLMEIASLPLFQHRDPPYTPVDHPQLQEERNIFHIIRDVGDLMIHHPYESFSSSVVRFLREASLDPKVRAIKMTLYRTSADSDVIRYLIDAVRNGKQVSVVLELKARFDEAANIIWANRLEDFGIHVNYGVVGFKTHCKVIMVVRRDYNTLRRYVHFGTGNYHAGTAKGYSDLGILTADEDIAQDVTQLFNYLTTGFSPKRKYRKILVAPAHLKKELLSRIDREIRVHKPSDPGLIQIKTNALEDADITEELYRASGAGVRINLIVRDSCRLRPGIPKISKTIRVVSIVGRFLEHSRIYYFRNGGKEEYFIGSADCMKRNLESRVEILAPVEDVYLQEEIRHILERQMEDNRLGWWMLPDGSYERRPPHAGRSFRGSQDHFIERAQKRSQKVSKVKRRIAKVKAKAKSATPRKQRRGD